jgi:hypothetical protein
MNVSERAFLKSETPFAKALNKSSPFRNSVKIRLSSEMLDVPDRLGISWNHHARKSYLRESAIIYQIA